MAAECGAATKLFNFEENPNSAVAVAVVILQNAARAYAGVHRYIAFPVCIFGILANFLHIAILTRPVMKRSTVNRLLAYMAVCDTLMMIDYLLYLIRFAIMVDPNDPPYGYPYGWICYLLGHVVLGIGLHAVSLYLSVATAFIRLTAISRVQSSVMQPRIAWKILTGISITVIVLVIPTFIVHRVEQSAFSLSDNEYLVGLPRQSDSICALFILNLWLTGILFKVFSLAVPRTPCVRAAQVIPCICLIIFTIGLLYKLHLNKISHEKIASKQATQIRCAQSDRTTILLVLLLFVFIITELPQGILAVLNAIYTQDINNYIYTHVGEFFDLLSLINGSVCFVLYPCISSQYRETFSLLVARARSRSVRLYRTKSLPLSTIRQPISECRSLETEFLGITSAEARLIEASEVKL